MQPNFKQAHRKRIDRDRAVVIGLQALSFLAEQPERIVQFLQTTGLEPTELAQRAQTTDLLRAVLEYVSADQSMLLMFAANSGIRPEDLATAIELLSVDE